MAHPEQTAKAIAELRRAYRDVPVGGLDGASDEESSYLHIIVCYAEYQKMKALVGEDRARHLMEFWANDHYRKIYRPDTRQRGGCRKSRSATRAAAAEALMDRPHRLLRPLLAVRRLHWLRHGGPS